MAETLQLAVAHGLNVLISGGAASGKTTLLNILGTLDVPTSGSAEVLGRQVETLDHRAAADLRNRHIGFIFQSFNLIDELTVAENIELALLYHRMPASERKQRVASVMERMGIAHRAKHLPGQLSGGQQQRVAVARAVVGNQPLILADEPLGNQDKDTGREVLELLLELAREGSRTVLMVTHDPRYSAYAERTIHLFDGRIVEERSSEPGTG